MKKRGFSLLLIVLIVLFVLIVIGGVYYFFFSYNTENNGNSPARSPLNGVKKSVEELSESEAVTALNESFVLYVLYNLGAQNLHNPPLSSSNPKIEFDLEGEVYNAEVQSGNILVNRGGISDEDIRIYTQKVEIVKMIKDSKYVEGSFAQGKSKLELVAGKTTLFAKGYLQMYEKVTGKKA
mgnify:CR=1 FL=1